MFFCLLFRSEYEYEAEVNGDAVLPVKETKVNRSKVPKREKFDRWHFPDFYTMKSLRVGDFGVKIKKNFKNI